MRSLKGMTLVEALMAAALLGFLGLAISQTQIFTVGSVGKADFGGTMDSFHLEAVTKVQSAPGLGDIRSWLSTGQPALRACLAKNGTACESLNDVRLPFEGNIKELKTRKFSKSGSLCTAALCDGSTRIFVRPECRASTACAGARVEVETEASGVASNKPRSRFVSLYISALKLVPTGGLDFTCAQSGAVITGFDVGTRKAICAKAPPVECESGVPGVLSGVGLVTSEPQCREMLNFASRDKQGLGEDTMLFRAGYKRIGLAVPVVPSSVAGALAQDRCGIIDVVQVSMNVGDRYRGVGTCPGNLKTLYRPGHAVGMDQSDKGRIFNDQRNRGIELEGTATPTDLDTTQAKWGTSQGVDYDFLFARPADGAHSLVTWHMWQKCCNLRADAWAPEQIASQYREEALVDVAMNRYKKYELIAIADGDPITSTFKFLDLDGKTLIEIAQNVTSVGSLHFKTVNRGWAAAEAVPASTPLGVEWVGVEDAKYLLIRQIVDPSVEAPAGQNTATYNYNVIAATLSPVTWSLSFSARVVINFTNSSGAVILSQPMLTPDGLPKRLANISARYVGYERVEIVPASTPKGIERVRGSSGKVILEAVNDVFPPGTPAQARQPLPVIIKDTNGVTLGTETLNVAPGDRMRVHYVTDFDWTLGNPSEGDVKYQLTNASGASTGSVVIPGSARARVTLRREPTVVNK
jgi:hypothetical protein